MLLLGAGCMPCTEEGKYFGAAIMNLVLIVLQVAVLITILVGYGRE